MHFCTFQLRNIILHSSSQQQSDPQRLVKLLTAVRHVCNHSLIHLARCCINAQECLGFAGETRVGIFALADIPSGEELSYDYQFQHSGLMQAAGAYRCTNGLHAHQPQSVGTAVLIAVLLPDCMHSWHARRDFVPDHFCRHAVLRVHGHTMEHESVLSACEAVIDAYNFHLAGQACFTAVARLSPTYSCS